MNPLDPLAASSSDDGRPYYATISGTSMACPCVAGIATLAYDAYEQKNDGTPAPTEILYTIEAEADDALSSYTTVSAGAGFVDAVGLVDRAERGTFASASQVDLV